MTSSLDHPPADATVAPAGATLRRSPFVTALESVPVPRLMGLGRDGSLLVWAWAFWGLGQGLWAFLWPVYLQTLGAGSFEVGLVTGVPFLFATLCYLPGGFVAQLGRHKWQMAFAHLLPTLAAFSYGLARSWWQVFPGVIVGSLVALAVPAINSFIAQVADDEHVPVPSLFTMTAAALYATMSLSAPLGGWIADHFGTATVFPLAGLCYVCAVSFMFMIRSRPAPHEAPAAPSGAAVQRTDEFPEATERRPNRTVLRSPGAARRGAVLAGMGAYRELLALASVRLILLTSLLIFVGMHIALSFGPLYLRDVYHYDRTWIGWVGSASSVGTVLLLAGAERFRRRFGLALAMAVSCLMLALHFGGILLSGVLVMQLMGFLLRGGFQSSATLATVALTEVVPRRLLASAAALQATVAGFAAMLAPPVGGWLFSRAPVGPFVAGAALLLLALPLLPRSFRAPPRAETPGAPRRRHRTP